VNGKKYLGSRHEILVPEEFTTAIIGMGLLILGAARRGIKA
jgi:hypothetical protein